MIPVDAFKQKKDAFLRGPYAFRGLSVRTKTKMSKIDETKRIIEAWGRELNEICGKKVLSRPQDRGRPIKEAGAP